MALSFQVSSLLHSTAQVKKKPTLPLKLNYTNISKIISTKAATDREIFETVVISVHLEKIKFKYFFLLKITSQK